MLAFSLYNVAPLGDSAHLVNLVRVNKNKETKLVAENISLAELYEKHVKPGQLLYMMKPIAKKTAENVAQLKNENFQLLNRTFGIFEANTIPGNDKGKGIIKSPGALKTTPISLSSPPDYFKLAMDRSYQFVHQGSPVEFSIAIKRTKIPKEDRFTGTKDRSEWPWLHEHFPHLRPDFILKSMPEGSRWSVEPVSDGRHLHFVIVKPNTIVQNPLNYTKRLFNVANSVDRMIRQGKQQQLPTLMRQRLHDAGIKNYSPLSSMPIDNPPSDEEAAEQDALSEYEETDNARMPLSDDRYMPEEKPKRERGRFDTLTASGRTRGKAYIKVKDRGQLHSEAVQAARALQRQATSAFLDAEPKHVRVPGSGPGGKRTWRDKVRDKQNGAPRFASAREERGHVRPKYGSRDSDNDSGRPIKHRDIDQGGNISKNETGYRRERTP